MRFVFAFTSLAVCIVAQTPTFISSGRPVADAVRKLESVYGWPITYEDPRYACPAELEDVTSLVRRDGKSSGEGIPPIFVPRGGSFTFTLDNVAPPAPGIRSPEVPARAAIVNMIKSYNGTVGGPDRFALVESDGMFHVVPVHALDASCTIQSVDAILDLPISISTMAPSFPELIEEICRVLSEEAHVKVGLPTTLQRSRTNITPKSGETARSVLSRLFAEQSWPAPFSWQLFCGQSECMLNVHQVYPLRE